MKLNEYITYNKRTKRICPSDWICFCVTHIIIIPPTAMILYVLVISDFVALWFKIVFIILNIISTYGSIRNLWKAAFTNPGIIPKNMGVGPN